MSGELGGRIGGWELKWRAAPLGSFGTVLVTVRGPEAEAQAVELEVSWRRDEHGVWLSTPRGAFGFDLEGEPDDEGRLTFRVSQRGGPGEWAGLRFLRAGEESALGSGGGKKKGVRVRAQMPGKIVRVMTTEGAKVEKDQALIVMEAMKMENEIRAPQAGKVSQLKVEPGRAVETGADLFVIDPE